MSTKPQAEDVFRPAIAEALGSCERVLIAGAGGGFDVFAGLPLFLSLIGAGKKAFLANLSFSSLEGSSAQRLSEVLWRVDHTASGDLDYFPELYLAEWLNHGGYSGDVYAFDKVGVRPLRAAYQDLCRDLSVDALILIDGGTDILMRGDEAGLGTPAEDMTSLAATRHLPISKKFISCLGFGIDAYHGVCHAHFLENVAAIEKDGGYLGSHSIHLSQPVVAKFRDAVEYAHEKMPQRQSIVNGSIVSALEGHFGNFHRTDRTRPSKLFINPLMAMYWHFDLESVANRSLYLETLESTETIFQVQLLIEAFRKSVSNRERAPIPV